MIYILMGVSGAGKTTIGEKLAEKLGIEFAEGDEFHSPENVAKMESGQPLSDVDRAPWLKSIAGKITTMLEQDRPMVLTCSALKRAYRKQLSVDREKVLFINLDGPYEIIDQRLSERTGHYMPAGLLQSQFDTLEPLAPDEHFITVAVDRPADQIVQIICDRIDQKD